MNWILKYLLSFRKSSWDLEDYPLRFRCQGNVERLGCWKPVPWTAQIVNWWLWDFYSDEADEPLFQKIRETYDVDVSNLKDGNLVKVFARIASHKARSKNKPLTSE